MRLPKGIRNATLTLLVGQFLTPANADPVSDFYAGKNISVVIGTGPVGAYADYAQLLVAQMKAHMPGKPTFVVQTMPGAGGMVAANHAYNVAPKDGTYLLVAPQNFAIDQALKTPAVRYDARQFAMVGRFNSNTPVAVGWTDSGVTSIDVIRQKEVPAGGAGPGSPTDVFPQLLNAVAGTKFKLISGYKGLNDMMIAMQRGEVHAMVGPLSSWQTVWEPLVREKKVSMLAQFSSKRHPKLPNLPTGGELSADPEGRAVADLLASGADVGRMLLAPPGVPVERIEALRKAMATMMKDAEFQAEAAKRKLDLDYLDAAGIDRIVDETLKAPEKVVASARKILGMN